jgi:acetyl-CoA/propionyl-CoA carboxylase biotin carboxyl carrier protein
MFDRVLVANRGEIVVRIARTLRRLGCSPATVYARADAGGMHVRCCDVSVEIASYLDADAIVAAAGRVGAQAVHPGYGFLSERPEFARACEAAGLVWIGPPAATIELMGDKVAAKHAAENAGLQVVPGLDRDGGLSDAEIDEFAQTGGLPLLIKAAAGGGGKGMRIVASHTQLEQALAAARREAAASFGNDALLVERYVSPARHIEAQLIADTHGTVLYLGERECSLQRRHQKVIEECPSPVVDATLRQRLGEEAVALAKACDYVGAGTVEFVAEAENPERHYFLEMNTRLQVEHAVTEAVLGIDLVEWQLRVAAGERLQAAPAARGHAIEARIYAEDPARGFLPASGPVRALRLPDAPDVRVDAGVSQGDVVSTRYDPMVAKVIVHAETRAAAIARLRAALGDTVLLGVRSNVGFLRDVLGEPDVVAGKIDTEWLERAQLGGERSPNRAALVAATAQGLAEQSLEPETDPFSQLDGWRISGTPGFGYHQLTVDGEHEIELAIGPLTAGGTRVLIDGVYEGELSVAAVDVADGVQRLLVSIDGAGDIWTAVADGEAWWVACGGDAWRVAPSERDVDATQEAGNDLRAPMPGTVVAVNVNEGAVVKRGDVVLVMESMKMELQITAPRDGAVAVLRVAAGDHVALNTVLASLSPQDGDRADS